MGNGKIGFEPKSPVCEILFVIRKVLRFWCTVLWKPSDNSESWNIEFIHISKDKHNPSFQFSETKYLLLKLSKADFNMLLLETTTYIFTLLQLGAEVDSSLIKTFISLTDHIIYDTTMTLRYSAAAGYFWPDVLISINYYIFVPWLHSHWLLIRRYVLMKQSRQNIIIKRFMFKEVTTKIDHKNL